jgi:hypothetical protein
MAMHPNARTCVISSTNGGIFVRESMGTIYNREFHWPRLNTSMTATRALGIVYAAFAARQSVPTIHMPQTEGYKCFSLFFQC